MIYFRCFNLDYSLVVTIRVNYQLINFVGVTIHLYFLIMFLFAFLMQLDVVDRNDKQSQELQLFPKSRTNHGIEVK